MKRAATVIGLTLVFLMQSSLEAQEDPALERLNTSPRHHEWVEIEGEGRSVHTFVVYPEVSEKVSAIVVIHENRGLNDWAKSLADQVAEAGYIAIAPDLLSGMAPGGGDTADFPDRNAARDAIYELTQEQVTADLHAVANFAKKIPAANGTIAVAGFCWGGSQTFHFATQRDDLAAAFPFYGTAPEDPELLARISCPVYGFYGGDDERVNATLEATAASMTAAGKTYEPVIYEGAGHGFMRAGEASDATEANRKGREDAWKRWLLLLAGLSD
jgi:carboxymethylenebutenolidase